ncbi:MAG: hypothetical protein WDA20_00405, partial [Desulfuromonadales bacterium]
MSKLLATLYKELLLVWRDRAGLLLLFAMPAALVLVVSLVQNNILETSSASLPVLLVDEDGGEVARRVEERLRELGALSLVREIPDQTLDAAAARQAVSGGDFQFAIVIPAGTTEGVRAHARRLAEQSLSGAEDAAPATEEAAELAVYFDPTVQGAFRTAVVSSLRLVILGVETEEKLHFIAELLPGEM